MANVNEIAEAQRYVYGLLQPLNLAPIHDGQAPESTSASPVAYPLIVLQCLPATDVMVLGAVRVWAAVPVLVKVATDQPSLASIEGIAQQIDAALHGTSGATATARIVSCVRAGSQALYPTENGIRYRVLAGRYTVCVQPL